MFRAAAVQFSATGAAFLAQAIAFNVVFAAIPLSLVIVAMFGYVFGAVSYGLDRSLGLQSRHFIFEVLVAVVLVLLTYAYLPNRRPNLLWAYYCCVIFLFGANVSAQWEARFAPHPDAALGPPAWGK